MFCLAPRLVKDAIIDEINCTVHYDVPVRSLLLLFLEQLCLQFQITIECIGEAPENVTVTIQCNETDVYNSTTEVDYIYVQKPANITGSVCVPQNEQCTISIVFINSIGSSNPYELKFSKCYVYIHSTLISLSLDTCSLSNTSFNTPSPSALPSSTPISIQGKLLM